MKGLGFLTKSVPANGAEGVGTGVFIYTGPRQRALPPRSRVPAASAQGCRDRSVAVRRALPPTQTRLLALTSTTLQSLLGLTRFGSRQKGLH